MKNLLERVAKLFHLSPLKIALMVVICCVLALINHYRSQRSGEGGIDAVGMMERALLDTRFRLRGEKKVSGEVGVLAIDEKSISKFGRWPFKRTAYEQAFDNLKKNGVQWIGFDVTYAEQERPYLDESIEDIEVAVSASQAGKNFDGATFGKYMEELLSASKGDISLSTSIENFSNIVQGYFLLGRGVDESLYKPEDFFKVQPSQIELVSMPPKKGLLDYPDIFDQGILANTDVVAGNSRHQGYLNNEPDVDGVFRQATLVKAVEAPVDENGTPASSPILAPALSLSLAMKFLNRDPLVEFDEAGINSIKLMDSTGETSPISLPVTYDGTGRMLINHYGGQGTFPYISLADAYDNNFEGQKLPKILILGGTALGINDMRASPFSPDFIGVEHHVAIIENIITKSFLKRPFEAIPIELAILIASGVFFSFLLRKASALTSALFLVTFCVTYYFVDRFFIFGRGYWMYMGMPVVQSVGIYFGVTLYKYFTEEKEKKKVKGAFQHYLSPAVISQILDNPDKLKLGGEKKELTVFFSDVRGFTTISETLAPEALAHLLNEYFTPMTKIILDSNGLLDKYIGDAIMAVWGAPISIPDHADRALLGSLEMLDALDVLRAGWKERGLPVIDIGMGINTGPMTVGNMGSDQRFDYTVMGDSVNLGARLEGITKQYGVRIICSEFTKAKLTNPKQFVMRELDSIQVKGKTEPVRIHEVLRFKAETRNRVEDLAGNFVEGLSEYRKQNWKAAEEKFMKCLMINPEDGPAQEFVKRCQYFIEHSPGNDWDGVWVMKTK